MSAVPRSGYGRADQGQNQRVPGRWVTPPPRGDVWPDPWDDGNRTATGLNHAVRRSTSAYPPAVVHRRRWGPTVAGFALTAALLTGVVVVAYLISTGR
jgi:hypothetical protein